MNKFTLFLALLFTVVATSIMSYISMATPIGPWVETIIILGGILLFQVIRQIITIPVGALGFATGAAGIGGIVATACGFSFPTLYFLDKSLFVSYLSEPLYFSALMAGLVLAGGLYGYCIALCYQHEFLATEGMSFAIGELNAKMINAGHSIKQATVLGIGFVSSLLYSLFQTFSGLIPTIVRIIPKYSYGRFGFEGLVLRTDLAPMLFAIGFVAGHVLALPLITGVLARWVILAPLKTFFFPQLSFENVILAFAGGLVVHSALHGIKEIPTIIIGTYKKISKNTTASKNFIEDWFSWSKLSQMVLVLGCIFAFLWYCKFTLLEQLYLLVFSFVSTYQLMIIGGKIGMAPMGRFATWALLPSLLIFGYDPLKATVISTFVELAGGVAVDTLFGQKMAQEAQLQKKTMAQYQLLGLIASALCIGILFWLLISRFGLGSPELLVQRAQGRNLLIHAFHFNYILLVGGIIFGFVLQKIKINPLLVLGGMVMAPDISFVLIAGGLSTFLFKDKEAIYPLWSGVFAASSLWMILKTFGL